MDAYHAAEAGQVTIAGLTAHSLTRTGAAHVKAAGLTPWPKHFQAMRSSCENDWKTSGIAEPTYTAWAGHSAIVSRKNYVAPLDTEYEVITEKNGGFTTRIQRADDSGDKKPRS